MTTVQAPVESIGSAAGIPSPGPEMKVETVIVDPPRTGMSREALDAVLHVKAARLIYVSCDVATLARDARRIVDAGHIIERADAFDMFPNTPHVETVAVFASSSETIPLR